jgi:16S rRNA processing protein RimM
MMTGKAENNFLCMAEIVGVHGVRGTVKLKVFGSDPENLSNYNPFHDSSGKKSFTLLRVFPHGNIWLADIDGVTDRTAAEKLRGVTLHISRDRLPDIKEEGTFYRADLVGLAAIFPNGDAMGKIITVANFGAGDLLEIKPPKGASFYVPFTHEVVPTVDIARGRVTVDPPPGLLD